MPTAGSPQLKLSLATSFAANLPGRIVLVLFAEPSLLGLPLNFEVLAPVSLNASQVP